MVPSSMVLFFPFRPKGEVLLNVLRCQLTYQGQVVTNAEARFNKSLCPRKPEGSLDGQPRTSISTLTQLLNYV